eukprot:665366-Prorocentrum_minimum.AAC.1
MAVPVTVTITIITIGAHRGVQLVAAVALDHHAHLALQGRRHLLLQRGGRREGVRRGSGGGQAAAISCKGQMGAGVDQSGPEEGWRFLTSHTLGLLPRTRY